MRIHLASEEEKERWDMYVMESSNSNCYHQFGWKKVIEKSFGHVTYYLLSENDKKQINGILPLVHIRSRLFGNFMVSLPYFNYGGLCTENEDSRVRLLQEAVHIARKEKIEHIELRETQLIGNGYPVKTTKVSMRLELPGSPEELWRSFQSKLRSQIRRPQKEGMYTRIGAEDQLQNFYWVFSMNMRDLGTPVYSISFFRNILLEYPHHSWICTVFTRDGKPIASGILLGFKDKLEIPWASSLRSHNCYGPNMFLYWSALKFACENGYRVFDFGRSTQGGGTYKFKEQWGAKPLQLYWCYWLRNGGPVPELSPGNLKYATAIQIWKKLPVALTRILGPLIVKNIP